MEKIEMLELLKKAGKENTAEDAGDTLWIPAV